MIKNDKNRSPLKEKKTNFDLSAVLSSKVIAVKPMINPKV